MTCHNKGLIIQLGIFGILLRLNGCEMKGFGLASRNLWSGWLEFRSTVLLLGLVNTGPDRSVLGRH